MGEETGILHESIPAPAATGWFPALKPRERRALVTCWTGWALDSMDLQLYTFAIPTLMAAWTLTRAEAGSLATTSLLMSSLGGWIAGILADRIGRVRTLQITVAWFALFSLLSGFAQSFGQMFLARGLLGLGFGGEYAVGAVLLSETIRAEWRGRTLGAMATASAVGWGTAALLYTIIFSALPADMAWRVLFIVGVTPALLVVVLRRFVSEPEIYRASEVARAASGARADPLEIFRPRLLGTTLGCALLATGAQGGYFAITAWLPTYLSQERGLNVSATGGYVGVTVLGSFFGYLVGAYLSDRIGRRGTFLLFGVAAFVTVIVYTLVPLGGTMMLMVGFPLGFVASGVFSATPSFFSELYPTHCRASGLGFVHNFGRGFGAVFPFMVGLLAERLGLAAAIGIFAGCAYGLLIVVALMLPETRGRELLS